MTAGAGEGEDGRAVVRMVFELEEGEYRCVEGEQQQGGPEHRICCRTGVWNTESVVHGDLYALGGLLRSEYVHVHGWLRVLLLLQRLEEDMHWVLEVAHDHGRQQQHGHAQEEGQGPE